MLDCQRMMYFAYLPGCKEIGTMKRTLSLILVSVFTLALLNGCNTVRGVGEDIEKGGEAIQKSSS